MRGAESRIRFGGFEEDLYNLFQNRSQIITVYINTST